MAKDGSAIKTAQRESFLDTAKGIALFFVVLGHLVAFRGTAYTWIFSFHMMLFFFISGYQFNDAKYAGYLNVKYVDKKVKSLLTPFVIATFIGYIICLIIPDWRYTEKDLARSLLYFAQPSGLQIGQIWFLIGLFWTEVLFFYLYRKIYSKVSPATVIFITVLISVIGFNINRVTFLGYPRLPWKIDSAITALVFYTVGFYTKKSDILNQLYNHKILSVVLTLLLGISGFYVAKYKNGYVNICDCKYGNYFYFYIAAFCGIVFILLLSKFLGKVKILEYYGRNTLWMFIVHLFLLSLSVNILNIITQKQYIRSNNIPFTYCFVIAVLVYLILGLVPVLINFMKKKLILKNNDPKKIAI